MSEESNNEENRMNRRNGGLAGRGVSEERQREEIMFYRRGALGEFTAPDVDLTAPRLSPAGAVIGSQSQSQITGFTAQINVTAVSQLVLPADPRRKFLFLQNNDPVGTCTVSFGSDAVLAVGMKLGANGGGILLDNHIPTSAIYIIGSILNNPNVTLIGA